MKVHHFNTYPYGGAAKAARRIHHGLVQMGVDSTFYYRINERGVRGGSTVLPVSFDSKSQSRWFAPLKRRKEKHRRRDVYRLFNQHLAQRQQGEHEVFAMARLPDPTRIQWAEHDCDIVHLHWMAHMIDHPTFFESIPRHVPIVWTLHDMGPFTGGCHYAGSCDRFRQGCGHCPQVVQPAGQDVSADSILAKQQAMAGRSMHVVAPSQWLIDLARQSPVWPEGTTFRVIHYGLDLSRFRPFEKESARQELGLANDKIVLGFGADDLSNERKGFGQLCESLRRVSASCSGRHPSIELAVFGNGEVPNDLKDRFNVHSFGFVERSRTLAKIYSACDFVLVPSLEDNQPQVGLEAMACGRPVVGFAAGGIPEYVVPGKTGQLVQARDQEGLAQAIVELAEEPSRCRTMGRMARAKIEKEFEVATQTREYLKFYQGLRQRDRSAAA